MRGLTQRWIGPDPAEQNAQAPLHERIARARGLGETARAREILHRPHLGLLHPPVELPGADAVALRLVAAVRDGRRIAIYGDYDADGITATAVLWHVIRTVAPECPLRTFVPDRFSDGYGLNSDALRRLHAEGVQTVVTVDCGITAVEQARVARELGLELLITDHHALEPDAEGRVVLPEADAIAHPALPDARAPFTDLCGAAVAFKVASRFARHWCGGERVAEVLQQTLVRMVPLVALATVADVMPLVDENRILVASGLRAMQRDSWVQAPGAGMAGMAGLRALLGQARATIGRTVDAEHLAFHLAPRLNAVGRLGHAAEAVELLTTADEARAHQIAGVLTQHNETRRAIEQRILDEACAMVHARGLDDPVHRALVLAHADWHEGVVGIVCSRLVERYGRPAMLLCLRPDGTAKGSGRAPEGVDLVGAVRACNRYLLNCGGHAAAAGVTVRAGEWEAFAAALSEQCAQQLVGREVLPTVQYDAHARVEEITRESLRALDALRPFGRGNREPVLLLRGLRVHTPPMLFGKERTHLEVHVKAGRTPLRAIWWRGGAHLAQVERARTLDVVASPRLSNWPRGGAERVELALSDVAIAE